MTRQKDLSDVAILNHLQRATEKGALLTAIPHLLNVTELSREEFQDNFIL